MRSSSELRMRAVAPQIKWRRRRRSGAERNAAADQPAHREASRRASRSSDHALDLCGLGGPSAGGIGRRRVHPVGGDDGRPAERADEVDRAGSSPISSWASRRAQSTSGFALVGTAARERDLAGMSAHVVAALGEDQARGGRASRRSAPAPPHPCCRGRRARRPPRGEQERAPARGPRQMITWTVPPSTLQAAPAT